MNLVDLRNWSAEQTQLLTNFNTILIKLLSLFRTQQWWSVTLFSTNQAGIAYADHLKGLMRNVITIRQDFLPLFARKMRMINSIF